MELNIKEKKWFDKFSSVGFENDNANLMARLKCLMEEYQRIYPDSIVDFRSFVDSDSHFYQFFLNSGRLKNNEIQVFIRNISDLYCKNSFIKIL